MTINRKVQPALYPISKPKFVQSSKNTLDNGLPVYSVIAGKQEVCKIDFAFNAGLWYQQKPLLAILSNAMLQEGSEKYSAKQIAEIFDFHGAYLQLSADYHHATVSVITLEKHLASLLPVAEDLIKHSIFPEKEFKNLIQRRKQRFLLDTEKVKVQCQKKVSEVLIGNQHPYCLDLIAEDFDNADRDDFLSYYHSLYNSNNCEIFVSGHFSNNSLQLLNQHFGDPNWSGTKANVEEKLIVPSANKSVHVLKPDSIQSAIRMGKLLVDKTHPDYFGLQILTTILGGYFSSRLMANIREEKGYTYGIGASFINLQKAGYLVIATEVDKNYEEDTIVQIFKEIERLRTDLVPIDELERVKQYLAGEFIRDFDGPFSIGQSFRNVHDFDLENDFYDDYFVAINTISSQRLRELAVTYLQPNSFHSVIVGKE